MHKVMYPRGAQSQANPGKGATPQAGIMATCYDTGDAGGWTRSVLTATFVTTIAIAIYITTPHCCPFTPVPI